MEEEKKKMPLSAMELWKNDPSVHTLEKLQHDDEEGKNFFFLFQLFMGNIKPSPKIFNEKEFDLANRKEKAWKCLLSGSEKKCGNCTFVLLKHCCKSLRSKWSSEETKNESSRLIKKFSNILKLSKDARIAAIGHLSRAFVFDYEGFEEEAQIQYTHAKDLGSLEARFFLQKKNMERAVELLKEALKFLPSGSKEKTLLLSLWERLEHDENLMRPVLE